MLFGDESPNIVIDPDGANIEIQLQHSIITRDEAEDDFIIHQSVFTGYRTFITETIIGSTPVKRKYWAVDLIQNVYKYGSGAAAFYNDVKQYEGTSVRFYRHSNGLYLKDYAGNEVKMFILSITEAHYPTANFDDYLIYKFRSEKYVQMNQGGSSS